MLLVLKITSHNLQPPSITSSQWAEAKEMLNCGNVLVVPPL